MLMNLLIAYIILHVNLRKSRPSLRRFTVVFTEKDTGTAVASSVLEQNQIFLRLLMSGCFKCKITQQRLKAAEKNNYRYWPI